jgi:hypothetical protein
MTINKQKLVTLLLSEGFKYHPPDSSEAESIFTPAEERGHYARPCPSNGSWLIELQAFYPPDIKNTYDYIELGLTQSSKGGNQLFGPIHAFKTDTAIIRGLKQAVEHLDSLAANPNSLKCPDCNNGWLIKHQNKGDKSYFLACIGMMKKESRFDGIPLKDLSCKGKGRGMEAYIIHR